jgi:NAD-dependent DNA ligase
MLLTELSQHSRFDVVRTMQSNGKRQAESVAVNLHRIVVGNRFGRKGNRKTQVIILKWIVE